MLFRSRVDAEIAALVGVCRKLSNYMMYLLVTHPVMLQVTASSAKSVLQGFRKKFMMMAGSISISNSKHGLVLQNLKEFLSKEDSALSLPEPCKETLHLAAHGTQESWGFRGLSHRPY